MEIADTSFKVNYTLMHKIWSEWRSDSLLFSLMANKKTRPTNVVEHFVWHCLEFCLSDYYWWPVSKLPFFCFYFHLTEILRKGIYKTKLVHKKSQKRTNRSLTNWIFDEYRYLVFLLLLIYLFYFYFYFEKNVFFQLIVQKNICCKFVILWLIKP